MARFTSTCLVAAAAAMVCSSAQAQSWMLLDSFDGYGVGLTTIETAGVWHAEFSDPAGDPGDHTANSQIVASDRGNSLKASGGAAWRGAERDLTGTDAAVLVGEVQTFFWQVKVSSQRTGSDFVYDFMMGLAPSVDSIDINNAWQDFSVMPFINNAPDTPYINGAAPTSPWWAPMSPDTWTNVWIVVNNDEFAPTYDLYYSTGTDDGVLVAANANWRNHPAGLDLNAIGFMAAGQDQTEYLVDNIYYTDGVNTSYAVPAPGAAVLIGLGGTLAGRRRRA